MDQHPVPRNVTGFEFQLIGFMTLKQFSYLVAGFIFAFICYKAPLSIFRLPLSAFFLFLGVAFAFLPIQERPLEIWVRNFIKSIYSPTQYVYQKETVHLPFLEEKPMAVETKPEQTRMVVETHQDAKQKLENYLKQTSLRKTSALDAYEADFLKKVAPLFSQRMSTAPPPANALPKGIVAGLIRENQQTLAGILINVKNQNGEVVRILKTDTNGKFVSKIPLASGIYEVDVEDPNKKYNFGSFQFKVNGEATVPWLIKTLI